MLKFDQEGNRLEPVPVTRLEPENILERYDLQKAVANSWEVFKNEIGLPSSYLIGQEVLPHESTQDSIDLLAYNPDDSSLVVIELKRHRHKLHLLQALTYAAMVSKWDNEQLISRIQRELNPEPEELVDLINGNELSSYVKVILIAESYDPQVILTSDWLSSTYSVDVVAFAISVHKMGDTSFFDFDQRYPLRELSDVYEARKSRKVKNRNRPDIQWQDVLPKLKYPFAERGIELCRKFREGEPSRRRFGNIRTNHDGFKWIGLNFREKYINVYLGGNFENDQDFLRSKFGDEITVNTWKDGLSFYVETESQFEDLVKWLNLE